MLVRVFRYGSDCAQDAPRTPGSARLVREYRQRAGNPEPCRERWPGRIGHHAGTMFPKGKDFPSRTLLFGKNASNHAAFPAPAARHARCRFPTATGQ